MARDLPRTNSAEMARSPVHDRTRRRRQSGSRGAKRPGDPNCPCDASFSWAATSIHSEEILLLPSLTLPSASERPLAARSGQYSDRPCWERRISHSLPSVNGSRQPTDRVCASQSARCFPMRLSPSRAGLRTAYRRALPERSRCPQLRARTWHRCHRHKRRRC